MKLLTIIEILFWILLTVIIFLIPFYNILKKGIYNIYTSTLRFFGIIKNMTPDDFLKSQHDEDPILENQDNFITSENQNLLSVDDNQDKKENTLSQTTPIIDQKIQEKIQILKQDAIYLKEKNKIEEAEKKLIEASTLHPHDREVQKLLHDIYFEQGKYIKSATLIKKLLLEEPNNHKLLRQLGYIHIQRGDLDIAKILISKALELKDDNPKYYISLVDIHIQQQQINLAIPLLEKLHKLRPENIDYLLSLASLHENTQNNAQAQYRYTKVIERDPHHPIAKAKLS